MSLIKFSGKCSVMADPYAKTSSREENDRIEYAASCTKGLCDDMQNYVSNNIIVGIDDSFCGCI
jgi:hypothetical protein